MRNPTRQRTRSVAAAVLVLAAIATPPAAAIGVPTGDTAPDAHPSMLAGHDPRVVRTDRAQFGHPSQRVEQALVGTRNATRVNQSQTNAVPGFDWADAGIGAGFALGLTVLVGGTALVVRHDRREHLATP